MKVFYSRLEPAVCKRIYDFALDQILNVSVQKKPVTLWTNFGWPQIIVKDSPAVLCFLTPGEFLNEIESCLRELEILNPETDCSLVNQGSGEKHSICLTYLWTPNSYIPVHRDGKHRKTATVYCNQTWSFEQGGVFQWLDSNTNRWESLVPSCGTVLFNDQDEAHATTPVKSSNDFRISLQIFILPK